MDVSEEQGMDVFGLNLADALAWDDVSGEPLDIELVRQARLEGSSKASMGTGCTPSGH